MARQIIVLILYLYRLDYVSSVFHFDLALFGYFVRSYIICLFFIE